MSYDIRWLVLDRADSVDAMAPILDGGPRPAWRIAAKAVDRGSPSPGGSMDPSESIPARGPACGA